MSKELVLTNKIRNKICHLLMTGVPLSRIVREKEMPSLTKIYNWIAKHKEFSNSIQSARRIGAQSYIEKAMDELEHADNRNIMIVREKVGLAKWLASKLIPIYGDRQEVKTDTSITIQWNTNDKNVVDVTPSVELSGEEIGITENKQS